WHSFMRIAQVAPLYESVPPKKYGGTERVVHYLTEGLLQMGHDVTLFASGDSVANGKLVPGCEKALRMNGGYANDIILHYLAFENLIKMQDDFDIIHFHTDYLHFPFLHRVRTSNVTTLHGQLDLPFLKRAYLE